MLGRVIQLGSGLLPPVSACNDLAVPWGLWLVHEAGSLWRRQTVFSRTASDLC